MRQLVSKIKPANGLSSIFHILFRIVLPLLVYILVRVNFIPLAIALILLSKWRMLAVKPRYWPANIRANAVDLVVGLSFLILMMNATSQIMQLMWAGLYAVWLIFIKPNSGIIMVSLQALVAQVLGLTALFLQFGDAPIGVLVVFTWFICYIVARHYFTSFDESLSRLMSSMWGYFGAAVAWLLSHWLLFYGDLAQPTLLLSVIAFGLATLYYLDHTDRLSLFLRRQFVFVIIAVVVIILAFSGWGDKQI